ncbi:MAG: hypothetical protein WAL84_01165 [Candidatus Dormiibacterota bacterium]
MTNPVAYVDYVRCKAVVNDEMLLTVEEQGVSAPGATALWRGAVIPDPAA